MVNTYKASKFLAYVLRHRPDSIGLTLDDHGYVPISDLIEALVFHKHTLSREQLLEIVATDSKQRFGLSPDGTRIRARVRARRRVGQALRVVGGAADASDSSYDQGERLMPALPPTQPPIERFISLDDRLGAAAAGVTVPDEPSRTVSASLANVPSQVHLSIRYGKNSAGAPLLELGFVYLDGNEEPKNPARVEESERRYGVDMSVGEHSGRIYRLTMKVVDLTPKSVDAFTQGIRACFKHYVTEHAAPLRQQAILASLSMLVQNLLPGLVAQVRGAV